MSKFVALLRGANVSGKNKLKMAELREALEVDGFETVQSYVQSGNLLVDAKKTTAAKVAVQIHALIETKFSLDVPVVVRTSQQWLRILKTNPYVDLGDEPKRWYVAFIENKIKAKNIQKLAAIATGGDTFEVSGTEIYLDLATGAGNTKLTNNAIEKKLNVVATTRNWRTVGKIAEMLNVK